ncbi:hypothetical protein D3C81_1779280 [compost metagenome]
MIVTVPSAIALRVVPAALPLIGALLLPASVAIAVAAAAPITSVLPQSVCACWTGPSIGLLAGTLLPAVKLPAIVDVSLLYSALFSISLVVNVPVVKVFLSLSAVLAITAPFRSVFPSTLISNPPLPA